jgi:predicted metal-dependent hydrolase
MLEIPKYSIERSKRRSIALHIIDGKLVVKAPRFVPEFFINNFVNQKTDWIIKNLKRSSKKTAKKTYQEGEEFLYMGDFYKLKFGDFKEINITKTLNVPAVMSFRIKKELTSWYIKKAKELISERVEYMSKKMGVKYKSIRFSDTSSKWGTCFADNSLQFNWRLIMTPITVINYVVVHELVHTEEKHHQQAFWKKVNLYTPAYKQHKKWLENNKHLLEV